MLPRVAVLQARGDSQEFLGQQPPGRFSPRGSRLLVVITLRSRAPCLQEHFFAFLCVCVWLSTATLLENLFFCCFCRRRHWCADYVGVQGLLEAVICCVEFAGAVLEEVHWS